MTTYRHVLGAPNKTPGTSIAPLKKRRNFRPAILMHFHTAANITLSI